MELQEVLRKRLPPTCSLIVPSVNPLSPGSDGRREESWLKSVQTRCRYSKNNYPLFYSLKMGPILKKMVFLVLLLSSCVSV